MFGETPHQYGLRAKIEKAKHYLPDSGLANSSAVIGRLRNRTPHLGARTAKQVDGIVGATTFHLTPDEIREIEEGT